MSQSAAHRLWTRLLPPATATTDSSVVGNWPVAVPFAFTAGTPGAVGALATTELSVVGNAVEHSRWAEA